MEQVALSFRFLLTRAASDLLGPQVLDPAGCETNIHFKLRLHGRRDMAVLFLKQELEFVK